jgi:AraC-like DNA-binding protein
MSNSTYEFLNRPDPLTTFFTNLNVESDVYANGDYVGDWVIDTSGKQRIPFHGVVSGASQVWLGDKYIDTIYEGDIVIFPFDHSHQMKPIDTEQTTRMICGFFNVKGISHQRLFEKLPAAIIHSTAQHASNLWQHLVNEIDNKQPGFYFAFNLHAKLLLLDVLRTQLIETDNMTSVLAGLVNDKINPALDVIHRKYSEPLSIEQLAHCCHLSKNTFTRSFKQSLGQTPYQYLSMWRLEKAQQLLSQNHLSISQVAEATGYQSDIVFRKAFKNYFGFNAYKVIKSG